MKFSEEIDKKQFDDFFKFIEETKEKEKKLFESQKLKDNCKKLDKCLIKIANSEKTQKIINFIEKFNVKKGNQILEEINKLTPLLEIEYKEQFRDRLKLLIQKEIFLCYEKFLEPKLKEQVINISKELFDAIDGMINKKN